MAVLVQFVRGNAENQALVWQSLPTLVRDFGPLRAPLVRYGLKEGEKVRLLKREPLCKHLGEPLCKH